MAKETRRPGLTRRSFLKATALTGGAAATIGLAGCSSIAEMPEETPQTVEEKTYSNTCRGNCGGMCQLQTKVREGKVVKTSPIVFDGEARLLQAGCVKGQSNPQRIYSTHRLLHPMKQTGERGSDNWEQITWDEAFGMIAEKFQASFDEYGPESVGLYAYGGNGNEFLSKMFFGFINDGETRMHSFNGIGFERFAQKTGITLFNGSADIAQLYIQMWHMGAASNSAEDYVNAKTILLWGANPADAQKHTWPCLLAAKKAGAKIVSIDPRFSNSSAHADMWVPIRPGSDGALMLAMCNHIIENDLIDYDYLRNKSIAPLLLKEDGSYLRLSDLGMDPVAVTAADGTSSEVDSEVVYDEASGTFGSSRTVSDPALTGTFDADGIEVRTVYDYALESIKPFTVDYAVEECGIPAETIIEVAELYATSTPASIAHWWGMGHFRNSWRLYFGMGLLASLTGNACKPGASYTPSSLASSIYQGPLSTNWQSLDLKEQKVSTMICANRIPSIVETGMWQDRPFNLRALLIMQANPLESSVDYNAMADAFDKIDFVVVHEQFMTDTAKRADLVLPCTMTWESEDFNGTWMDQKAIEPIGEGKSNFEVFVGMANALGYTDLYDKDGEGYLREILDTPENLEAGLGFDVWREEGAILGDFAKNAVVGQETNPTGRTQFYLEYLPPRDDMGQALTLQDKLPSYEHPGEAYASNPLREKYPLFGVSYHDNYTGQTMFSHVPWLNDLRGYEGEPYVLISETAANERGIETGDTVKVYNDRGYVVIRAVVTKGLQEDTIVVPRGYGSDQFIEGNVHELSSIETVDWVVSNDSHNDWLCQVEKM